MAINPPLSSSYFLYFHTSSRSKATFRSRSPPLRVDILSLSISASRDLSHLAGVSTSLAPIVGLLSRDTFGGDTILISTRNVTTSPNCQFYHTAAMDLASLKEAAANLTLYDLKAGVRKVQNGRVLEFRQLSACSQ